MSLKTFNVVFDNEVGVYYAGQEVTGRVLLGLNKPKTFRCLQISAKGVAEVRWNETRTQHHAGAHHHHHGHMGHHHHGHAGHHHSTNKTVTYAAKEKYFKHSIVLLGQPTGGDCVLPQGDHSFPFRYVLPQGIPSSFESDVGKIRYSVKATVVRPWKFNHDVRVLHSVVSPLDLNLHPNLREPVERVAEKTFGVLLFKSGPLKVRLRLPKGGVVPGEALTPSLQVDNSLTEVPLSAIKLQFVKQIRFHGKYLNQSKTKETKVRLGQKILGNVPPKGSRIWNDETFPIQPLPPSNLQYCNIIDVNYIMRVKCVPGGVHRKLCLDIPITLGTVPFHQNVTSAVPMRAAPLPPAVASFAPSAPLLLDPSAMPYTMPVAPPSYEEAMGGAMPPYQSSSSTTEPPPAFTPLYPVFSPLGVNEKPPLQ